MKKIVGNVYSPARAENCKVVKANPEGQFTGDKPVVRCSYDRVCQRSTGGVTARPLPRPTGRTDPKAGAACAKTVELAQKKISDLNESFAGESKGVLGQKVTVNGNTVEVSFNGAWWGGADGWSFDASESDTKSDLLPKIQAKALQFFPNIKCSAVKANPEGVFLAPQSVVACETKMPCGG